MKRFNNEFPEVIPLLPILPIVIVAVIIILLQLWNRRVKQPKLAPKAIFPLHKVAGIVLIAVFLIHGLPKLLSGWAPLPNAVTGALLAIALICTVVFGALASSAKGPRRRSLALGHRVGAGAAAVLVAAHIALAVL